MVIFTVMNDCFIQHSAILWNKFGLVVEGITKVGTWMLFPTKWTIFSYNMASTTYFPWDDDVVCFPQDQHADSF